MPCACFDALRSGGLTARLRRVQIVPLSVSDPIPFLDLRPSVAEMRAELDAAYARVMDSGSFILGAELAAFEDDFATACEARYAVGVGNGLDALTLILLALGVGAGDEVIVPSNTFIATWLSVDAAGARVVPVEPDAATYNLDPARVEAAISPRTRAIVPVHLYGQSADMTALSAIAERHGLALLADAAQAAGARWGGRNVGSLGTAAAFSFYPTKNLGALADGGGIVTNDETLAAKVRKLRNYGGVAKNQHELKGTNSRLGELQAAFLRCRLVKLEEWNTRRQALAARYLDRLKGHPMIGLPAVPAQADPVWHLFTIRIGGGRRDALRASLDAQGIGTGIYYPVPPHRTPAFSAHRAECADLPIADQLAATVLSLPLHPHLPPSEVDRVCDCLLAGLG